MIDSVTLVYSQPVLLSCNVFSLDCSVKYEGCIQLALVLCGFIKEFLASMSLYSVVVLVSKDLKSRVAKHFGLSVRYRSVMRRKSISCDEGF